MTEADLKKLGYVALGIVIVAVAYEVYPPVGLALFVIAIAGMFLLPVKKVGY
jgi:hypothetical protein